MLEKLIRSKAAVKVLSIILFTDGLHLREIARKADLSSFETKRELDTFCALSLLTKEKKGNLILFSKNPACSFFDDVRNLYLKTDGYVGLLRSVFRSATYSFIFGSVPMGTYNEKSDIDLLIIGDMPEEDVSSSILEIQKSINQEINFIVWSQEDLLKKLKEQGQFIRNIVRGKKIWIAGDESEFSRLTQKRSGPQN